MNDDDRASLERAQVVANLRVQGYNQADRSAHETISKLRIELAFAQDQVRQLQDKCQASKVVELERNVEAMRGGLDAVCRDRAEVEQQLERERANHYDTQCQRDAARNQCEELKLRVSEFSYKLSVATVDLERAQARAAALEQEKQQLVDELAGLKGQMARRRRR